MTRRVTDNLPQQDRVNKPRRCCWFNGNDNNMQYENNFHFYHKSSSSPSLRPYRMLRQFLGMALVKVKAAAFAWLRSQCQRQSTCSKSKTTSCTLPVTELSLLSFPVIDRSIDSRPVVIFREAALCTPQGIPWSSSRCAHSPAARWMQWYFIALNYTGIVPTRRILCTSCGSGNSTQMARREGEARRGSSRLVRERLLGNCDKLPQFIGIGRESLLVHCWLPRTPNADRKKFSNRLQFLRHHLATNPCRQREGRRGEMVAAAA